MDSLKTLSIINALLNVIPSTTGQDRELLCEAVVSFGRQLMNECRINYASDPMIIQNIGKLVSELKSYLESGDAKALERAHASVATLKGGTGFGIRRM